MKRNLQIVSRLGVFLLLMLSVSLANAQQTTGDIATKTGINYGTDNNTTDMSVRVIDNKGTIKYLQVQNGITTLTNTTAGVTTTTWQLGGALTNDTYIDVDGSAFVIDGIELVDITTEAASTDATTLSDAGPDGDTAPTGTGWTFLVRDEATGATKKLLASDLIQNAHAVHTIASTATLTYSVTGINVGTDFTKVSVYRNGAKLLAGVDYTVADNGTDSDVTLIPNPGTGVSNWDLYVGDVIEVHTSR